MECLIVVDVQSNVVTQLNPTTARRLRLICETISDIYWLAVDTGTKDTTEIPEGATVEYRKPAEVSTKKLLHYLHEGRYRKIYIAGMNLSTSIAELVEGLSQAGYFMELIEECCGDICNPIFAYRQLRRKASVKIVSYRRFLSRVPINVMSETSEIKKQVAFLVIKYQTTMLRYHMRLADYVNTVLVYEAREAYFFDDNLVWQKVEVDKWPSRLMMVSTRHLLRQIFPLKDQAFTECISIRMRRPHTRAGVDVNTAEMETLHSLKPGVSTFEDFLEILSKTFPAEEAIQYMSKVDSNIQTKDLMKELLVLPVSKYRKLLLDFDGSNIYFFDADDVYKKIPIEDTKTVPLLYYFNLLDEDKLQQVLFNQNTRNIHASVKNQSPIGKYSSCETERKVIATLTPGESTVATFATDVMLQRAQELFSGKEVNKRGLEILMNRMVSSAPTVNFGRENGNNNTKTFDFITVDIFLTKLIGSSLKEYIQKYRKQLVLLVWRSIESNRSFGKYGVPLSFLKITKMTYNGNYIEVTVDFKDEVGSLTE